HLVPHRRTLARLQVAGHERRLAGPGRTGDPHDGVGAGVVQPLEEPLSGMDSEEPGRARLRQGGHPGAYSKAAAPNLVAAVTRRQDPVSRTRGPLQTQDFRLETFLALKLERDLLALAAAHDGEYPPTVHPEECPDFVERHLTAGPLVHFDDHVAALEP